MEKKLYGLKEAAGILGVSFTWLDLKARAGKIPYVNMGRNRMMSDENIDHVVKHGVDHETE